MKYFVSCQGDQIYDQTARSHPIYSESVSLVFFIAFHRSSPVSATLMVSFYVLIIAQIMDVLKLKYELFFSKCNNFSYFPLMNFFFEYFICFSNSFFRTELKKQGNERILICSYFSRCPASIFNTDVLRCDPPAPFLPFRSPHQTSRKYIWNWNPCGSASCAGNR